MNSGSEKEIASELSQNISKDEAPPSEGMQQALDGLQKIMGGGKKSKENKEEKSLLQQLIELIIKLIKMLLGLDNDKPKQSAVVGKFEINPEMMKQAKQFMDDNPFLKKIGQKVLNTLHEKGYLEDKQFEAINKELFSPKAESKPLRSPDHPLQQDNSVEQSPRQEVSQNLEQTGPAAGHN